MALLYRVWNGAMPTTAALPKVTTGTVIKTMLQIKLKSGVLGYVAEWGIGFDGSALATPIACELIETGTVFATVTAHVASGIVKFAPAGAPDPTTAFFEVSTTATGFTASAEGTTTASRLLDSQLVSPADKYVLQFPLGARPEIDTGTALRVRVTAGAAVNAWCYVLVALGG